MTAAWLTSYNQSKIIEAFEVARQKTATKRRVRYKANAVCAASGQNIGFDIALPQRIL